MISYRGRHQAGLQRASARVQAFGPDGAQIRYGTGVFVAPGLLATCAHNLPAAAGGRYQVTVEGRRFGADVLVKEPADADAVVYSHPDVALLRVPTTDHAIVPIGATEPGEGAMLYAWGWVMTDGLVMTDPMTLEVEALRELESGGRFLRTGGQQVQPGSSGAGAIDLNSGLLVGLVKLSRDVRSSSGAVLVPARTMLDAFAASPWSREPVIDVGAANAAATRDADTLDATRRRLGWAWEYLINAVKKVAEADADLLLARLGITPDRRLAPADITYVLLHRELDDLARGVVELARASGGGDLPRQVLDRSLPFVMLRTRPWVAEDGAAMLAAERELARPRLIHLTAGCTRTVRLYAERATVRKPCRLIELSATDAVPAAGDELNQQLVTAVRAELLIAHGSPDLDPEDAERLADEWKEDGPDALADGAELLFLLPPGTADGTALDALHREFPGVVFAALTATGLPAGLAADETRVISLPGSLAEADERRAERRYGQVLNQIDDAVNPRASVPLRGMVR